MMSLDHILLGILNAEPQTGYEINKRYQYVFKYFWPADQRTIYRALNRMYENSWVDVEMVYQDDSPNKKRYHLTPVGKAELEGWLRTPLPVNYGNAPWLAQLVFSRFIEPKAVVVNLSGRLQQLRANLKELHRRYEQDMLAEADLILPLKPEHMTALSLAYGIASLQFQITWLEKAIHLLSRFDEASLQDLHNLFQEFMP
jgi:DNA-binding PadR family transcriptional regulator